MSQRGRREFLADVGRGMLAGSVGVSLAAELGLGFTADGWMYRCNRGVHFHNDSYRLPAAHPPYSTPWASGQKQGIAVGGTVGLLLRRGSLAVYIQGRRVGVMCTGLSGPLVWATDLYDGVRISRRPPPPAE